MKMLHLRALVIIILLEIHSTRSYHFDGEKCELLFHKVSSNKTPLQSLKRTTNVITKIPNELYPRLSPISTIILNRQGSLNLYPKLFQPKNVSGKSKQSIGFPSLEASLLSLSFLTFAVYLINLIQVLIKSMQTNNNNG